MGVGQLLLPALLQLNGTSCPTSFISLLSLSNSDSGQLPSGDDRDPRGPGKTKRPGGRLQEPWGEGETGDKVSRDNLPEHSAHFCAKQATPVSAP